MRKTKIIKVLSVLLIFMTIVPLTLFIICIKCAKDMNDKLDEYEVNMLEASVQPTKATHLTSNTMSEEELAEHEKQIQRVLDETYETAMETNHNYTKNTEGQWILTERAAAYLPTIQSETEFNSHYVQNDKGEWLVKSQFKE